MASGRPSLHRYRVKYPPKLQQFLMVWSQPCWSCSVRYGPRSLQGLWLCCIGSLVARGCYIPPPVREYSVLRDITSCTYIDRAESSRPRDPPPQHAHAGPGRQACLVSTPEALVSTLQQADSNSGHDATVLACSRLPAKEICFGGHKRQRTSYIFARLPASRLRHSSPHPTTKSASCIEVHKAAVICIPAEENLLGCSPGDVTCGCKEHPRPSSSEKASSREQRLSVTSAGEMSGSSVVVGRALLDFSLHGTFPEEDVSSLRVTPNDLGPAIAALAAARRELEVGIRCLSSAISHERR